MIIRRAVLKVDELEYDILRFNYKFQRDVDAKGRPRSVYYGGNLCVQFESTDDTKLLQRMIHKNMPTIDGSIEVLSGCDELCIRRIEFKDAYIYSYGESLPCMGWQPMTTTVAISPMRLNFHNNRLPLDRRWPETTGHWTRCEKKEVKHVSQAITEEKEQSPECTVRFRRCKDYDGSFGFDWLRMGDTSEIGCGWYRNCMDSIDAYDRLVATEYRSFDQSWRQKSGAHQATSRYVIPWVTLMKGATAKFRVKVEVNQPSKTLNVKVVGPESAALSVNLSTIDAQQVGDYYNSTDMKVTCISPFSSELAVEVRAGEELVGKMIFVPNGKIQSLDIAIVTVKTKSIKGGKIFRRKPDAAILDGMRRLLQQAYIVPRFKFYELDLSQPAECTVSGNAKVVEVEKFGGIVNDKNEIYLSLDNNDPLLTLLWKQNEQIQTRKDLGRTRFDSVHDFLNNMLNYTHPSESQMLSNMFKMYFIDEPIFASIQVAGLAQAELKAACISAAGYTEGTTTHELLHCLSLDHTFGSKSIHIFQRGKTDNIMDYDENDDDINDLKSLAYWQIKQIRKKLQDQYL